MKKIFKLSLQFFGGEGAGAAGSAGASGTGAGEGNGDGAMTGVNNAAADAEQRLRELGVPESKIRKRASKATSTASAQTVRTVPLNRTEKPRQTPPLQKITPRKIMLPPSIGRRLQKILNSINGSKQSSAPV